MVKQFNSAQYKIDKTGKLELVTDATAVLSDGGSAGKDPLANILEKSEMDSTSHKSKAQSCYGHDLWDCSQII